MAFRRMVFIHSERVKKEEKEEEEEVFITEAIVLSD